MKERIKLRMLCIFFDWMQKLFGKKHCLNLYVHDINEVSLDKRIWVRGSRDARYWRRRKQYYNELFDIDIFTKQEDKT